MALDAQIQALLQVAEQVQGPPVWARTPEDARQGARLTAQLTTQPDRMAAVAAVEALTIPGPGGDLAARLYRPAESSTGGQPTVVFFHGGGWVVGDLDTHDAQARRLCHDAAAVVVSVDYRLAPEHPFPAAYDDALAATCWAADTVGDLGGDPARLAVAGDSAGGNLAAAVSGTCRSQGPALAAQLLLYPCLDVAADTPSRQENAEGYLLTLDAIRWYVRQYTGGDPALATDPRVSPLVGDLSGLPPTVMAVAEFDPLRDEGLAYADALAAAGVPVTVLEGRGLVHGYYGLDLFSRRADDEGRAAGRALGRILGSVARDTPSEDEGSVPV